MYFMCSGMGEKPPPTGPAWGLRDRRELSTQSPAAAAWPAARVWRRRAERCRLRRGAVRLCPHIGHRRATVPNLLAPPASCRFPRRHPPPLHRLAVVLSARSFHPASPAHPLSAHPPRASLLRVSPVPATLTRLAAPPLSLTMAAFVAGVVSVPAGGSLRTGALSGRPLTVSTVTPPAAGRPAVSGISMKGQSKRRASSVSVLCFCILMMGERGRRGGVGPVGSGGARSSPCGE